MEHTLRHDITRASSECKTELKFDNSLEKAPQNLFIIFKFPCWSNEIVACRSEANQTELNCYISRAQVFFVTASFLSLFTMYAFCILSFPRKKNSVQKNRNLNQAALELSRLHCVLNNVKENFDHNWSEPAYSQDASFNKH
jgi:hypothetical protein